MDNQILLEVARLVSLQSKLLVVVAAAMVMGLVVLGLQAGVSTKLRPREHEEFRGTFKNAFQVQDAYPTTLCPGLLCRHRHGTLEACVAQCLSQVLVENRHAD